MLRTGEDTVTKIRCVWRDPIEVSILLFGGWLAAGLFAGWAGAIT